jgi:hypothetical protein
MHQRRVTHFAIAAIVTTLIGACADDDSSTTATDPSTGASGASTTTTVPDDDAFYVAKGTVEFDGTGEAQFTPSGLTISLQCSDTARSGMVIVGGEVTATTSDNNPPVGATMAVVILEADRDRVALWFEETGPDDCEDVVASVPADIANNPSTTLVAAGDDIETGWDCEDLCSRP